MALCALELLEEQGQGPTVSIEGALVAIEAFRDMSPAERRKPANAARFKELTAYLDRHADWLCCLGPVQEQSDKGDEYAGS
jgi:hypothetical protein